MDMTRHSKGKRKQQGLVLVLVTVAMLSFVIMAALAIDVTHQVVNRTKLQNAVDAAALAAAMVADATHNTTTATSAAKTTLTSMHSASGNSELDIDSATFSIDYSNDPLTFPDSSFDDTGDIYVRVSVDDLSLSEFFMQALGMSKEVSAAAVAGPSSSLEQVCNLVPMSVCASSGANGFNPGDLYMLKAASTGQTPMGPGNYQLLDFGSGASTIRKALAGDFQGCVSVGETVQTKPGNNVGPVGQGINTRFGVYSGGGLNDSDYPSDVYVKEPSTLATVDNSGNITYSDTSGSGGSAWGYDDYLAALPDCTGDSACRLSSGGQYDRRVIKVPIVDCSASSGGTTSVTVTAIGCFFLLQQAPTNNSSKEGVFGEYLQDCSVTAGSGGTTPGNQGAYKIIMYKDPNGGGA
ncbi:pilus assembly protein TadG-related protein [Vibrio vulnificus]|uniref:pilus assembly protein TadG-related protein n=1 Tax=Vibrio vulnificus TaxID=672 RepID=UPI003ED9257D